MYKKRIPVGELGTNCYIVMDEATKEAFIVDPGDDAFKIVNEIKKASASVKFVLLTHGHFDHTGAAIEISNEYNVDIYMNKNDLNFVEKNNSIFVMKDYNRDKIKAIDESVTLTIGNREIKCIETPGHSQGGVCYHINGLLISGDTLFRSSIGRTDFEGGNYDVLLDSVRKKIFNLNEDVIVLPGHGPETTVGYEKKNNPFF